MSGKLDDDWDVEGGTDDGGLDAVLREHSVWSRIQLSIAPSFETPVSYILANSDCRPKSSWFVVRCWDSPKVADDPGGFPLKNLFEVADVQEQWAKDWKAMFAGLFIPVVTEFPCGLDGVSYNLSIWGGLSGCVRLSWWSDGPSAWKQVTETAQRFAKACVSLNFERFYLELKYAIQVELDGPSASTRELMLLRQLDPAVAVETTPVGLMRPDGRSTCVLGVYNRDEVIARKAIAEQLGLRVRIYRSNQL